MPSPRWYRAVFRLYPPSFPESDRAELSEMAAAEWERAPRRGQLGRALVTGRLGLDHLIGLAAAWASLGFGSRRGGTGMDALWQDVRYAWRALARSPGFLAVAVTVIAIGIAATATILSVGNALLFRPPRGVVAPGELVTLHEVARDGSGFHSFSYPDFTDLRDGRGSIEEIAAHAMMPASLRMGGEPVLVLGFGVTGGYFRVVGTKASLGRLLSPTDDAGPGGARVAVMSHSLWTKSFAADSTVVGKAVTVNGQPFTIVGVTERGFRGHMAALDVGLWVPLRLSRSNSGGSGADSSGGLFESRGENWLELIGRAPGVGLSVIDQRLSAISARTGRAMGLDFDRKVDTRRYSPMPAQAFAPALGFVGLLLLLAVLVLAVAGTNVAGIMVARTTARAKETAIRLSVGATRGRLVRLLVSESMIVFLLGGALGVAGAWWITTLLTRTGLPLPIPVQFDFRIDPMVLAIVGLLALVAGLGFGVAPALRATRDEVVRSLKAEGARAALTGGGQRFRRVLVVSQMAASALLVLLATFFVKAVGKSGEVDVGFDPTGIQAATVDLSVLTFSAEETSRFVADVETALRATPGVIAAAAIDLPPLSLANQTSGFEVPGREAREGVGLFGTDFARVTPGYFATMGIPLLRGRAFTDGDRAGGSAVAVINETLAKQVWPDQDPVGQSIRWGRFTGGVPTVIVGVAKDGKYRSLGEDPRPEVYLPMAQDPPAQITFVARQRVGGAGIAGAMKQAIQAVEPNLPLAGNSAYQELIDLGMLPNRVAASLASAFGLVGLALAMVGLYGVLSYLVLRRRREIGVRIALGAPPSQVRRLILREGAVLAGIGLFIGVSGALVVARLASGLLFGVDPQDPLGIGSVVVVLGSVALLAGDIPARRAAATEPSEVLRDD